MNIIVILFINSEKVEISISKYYKNRANYCPKYNINLHNVRFSNIGVKNLYKCIFVRTLILNNKM